MPHTLPRSPAGFLWRFFQGLQPIKNRPEGRQGSVKGNQWPMANTLTFDTTAALNLIAADVSVGVPLMDAP